MIQLPIIDLERLIGGGAAAKRAAAGELGVACRETGFFCVAGHGICAAERQALFDASREFFALPLERKRELSISRSPHNRGYVGMETERLDTAALPDRKEAFNIGLEMDPNHPEIQQRRPLRGINFWPDIPGWRAIMLDYYARCLEIGRQLHRGISLDLGIEEDYFDSRITLPAAVLRLLHYPARAHGLGSTPQPSGNQPGAGEHTDYGNITLLATDGVAGLEVRQLDGTWVEVADTDELLLCNIGDCLMRWTNDVYRSTPHRVRVPDAERYSIAFFLDPNPDALVDPILSSPDDAPRYPPIAVRDYLQSRLDATYLHRQSAAPSATA